MAEHRDARSATKCPENDEAFGELEGIRVRDVNVMKAAFRHYLHVTGVLVQHVESPQGSP